MLAEAMVEHDLVVLGDNLPVLCRLPSDTFQLIYIDPPFNTGNRQERRIQQAVQSDAGGHVGFGGKRYATSFSEPQTFADQFDDYLDFLRERLIRARELLTETGTLYLHIDYREAHYCKILLDHIFGRDAFLNEIVGPTITAGGRGIAGLPSTTQSSSTSNPPAATTSIRRHRAHPLHGARACHAKKPRAANSPLMSGGTRSCPPMAARKLATRPRNQRAFSPGSSRLHPRRAIGCSIFLPAAGPPAPLQAGSDDDSCWSIPTLRQSRSCATACRLSQRGFSRVAGRGISG